MMWMPIKVQVKGQNIQASARLPEWLEDSLSSWKVNKMSAISVNVKAQYIKTQSVPAEHRYVYAYTITIANQGDEPAQLISRDWRITDANEKLQEVQGLGVVGEQPHLKPGETYTYTSGVILETETGLMEGTYQMRTDAGAMFDAPIPAFALVPPHAVH